MNIVFATASQIAQSIREKKVSAVEVLDTYLEQIEKYNDQINAVITLNTKVARQRAKAADEALARGENWGLLHGVPISLKDTLETAGLRTTAGYHPLSNYIPDRDATTVARLKAAGAIVIGKTNLPKLAIDYQSNNPLFGQTNNPWNLNYTTGGSSGGSASAVAAGFSALDLGSDFGGSIRLPAHYCGVYGFMPTDGRVPTAGHIPPLPGQPRYVRHMLRVGSLARSVKDLELCLSLMGDVDSKQKISLTAFDEPRGKQLLELKIAWTYGYDFLPISRDTQFCIKDLIDSLTNSGCDLTESNPADLDWSETLTDYSILAFFELFASTSLKDMMRGFQFALKNEFFTQTQTNYKSPSPFSQKANLAFPPSLAKYKAILSKRDRTIEKMDSFMDRWDAWICPVSLSPAFPHSKSGRPIEIDGVKFPYLLACGGYTMPLNFTGNPVVVIPVGQSKLGLPIGVQIVGKRWQDESILAIANQISRVVGNLKHPKFEE